MPLWTGVEEVLTVSSTDERRDLSDALNALNMLRKLPEDTLHRGAACRADAVQTAIRVAPRWVCAEPQPFDFTSRRSQMQQGGFVICYLDYCDASSSSRSAAGYSTEQKPAFRGARSDTAGTSDLRWRPSCDNPCGSCRSNACCSRLLYSRGSYRLADWQRPSSPQVQQGQRSEEVNSDIGIHGARWSPLAQDSHSQNRADITVCCWRSQVWSIVLGFDAGRFRGQKTNP
jgi:hypothetical protein